MGWLGTSQPALGVPLTSLYWFWEQHALCPCICHHLGVLAVWLVPVSKYSAHAQDLSLNVIGLVLVRKCDYQTWVHKADTRKIQPPECVIHEEALFLPLEQKVSTRMIGISVPVGWEIVNGKVSQVKLKYLWEIQVRQPTLQPQWWATRIINLNLRDMCVHLWREKWLYSTSECSCPYKVSRPAPWTLPRCFQNASWFWTGLCHGQQPSSPVQGQKTKCENGPPKCGCRLTLCSRITCYSPLQDNYSLWQRHHLLQA